jgi:hypothetical protein
MAKLVQKELVTLKRVPIMAGGLRSIGTVVHQGWRDQIHYNFSTIPDHLAATRRWLLEKIHL